MAEKRLYVRIQNHDDFMDEAAMAVAAWLEENATFTGDVVVDASMSIPNAAAEATAVGAEIKKAMLQAEVILGTVQSITFDTAGNVESIVHKTGNVNTRTDAFTFTSESITEVRTLNTGEKLTLVTNLETLQTTATYTS